MSCCTFLVFAHILLFGVLQLFKHENRHETSNGVDCASLALFPVASLLNSTSLRLLGWKDPARMFLDKRTESNAETAITTRRPTQAFGNISTGMIE